MTKIMCLKKILAGLEKVVVAYSGGLDSTFLLKAAIDTLGRNNVLAITARSETYPLSEYREAVKIAKSLGAKQLTIHTGELKIKRFRANPVNRCYYCKRELFRKLNVIRKKRGFSYVLDGTNYDDLKDVRYGRKAALELGVRSPLLKAKIGKDDIRRYSRKLRLPTWDKPSFACLASRMPFGSKISEKDLRRIDRAESLMRSLGFRQVRVRLHGNMARIEVLRKDFKKMLMLSERISRQFKLLEFVYVTIDLGGYRTGSMHEAE